MKAAATVRILAGCALGVMICLAATADARADDVRVQGGGSAYYGGTAPDTATRAAALRAAKVDCVSDYVRRLSETEHPLPVEYRDYFFLAFHPELQGRIDEYLSGVTIVREWTDAANKNYSVVVIATLNEQRFRATISWPKD